MGKRLPVLMVGGYGIRLAIGQTILNIESARDTIIADGNTYTQGFLWYQAVFDEAAHPVTGVGKVEPRVVLALKGFLRDHASRGSIPVASGLRSAGSTADHLYQADILAQA